MCTVPHDPKFGPPVDLSDLERALDDRAKHTVDREMRTSRGTVFARLRREEVPKRSEP
jgi:hypothetical protein